MPLPTAATITIAGCGRWKSCWLRKALLCHDDVDRLAEAWQRAAHATPHGKPILLENDPEHQPAR